MHELVDALRVMGKSERDVQQLLKELVAPFPSTIFSQRQRAFGRFERFCAELAHMMSLFLVSSRRLTRRRSLQ